MSGQSGAMLLVESGLSARTPVFLETTTFAIGKASSADFSIDNPFVSRVHCQIRFAAGSFFLSDLGSRNGTSLNGVLLERDEESLLNDGDSIILAQDVVHLRFRQVSDQTMTHPHGAQQIPSDIRLDSARDAWIRGEKLSPPLSAKEFNVLELLYMQRGTAVSRDDVASAGWPEREDGDVGNKEIEQCIRRIRRRIERDPSAPELIVTRRSFGYIMP